MVYSFSRPKKKEKHAYRSMNRKINKYKTLRIYHNTLG